MSAEQHLLREFLDAELAHTLGAYRVAAGALEQLGDNLPRSSSGREDVPAGGLAACLAPLTAVMTEYNRRLHQELHAASDGRRHPMPRLLPWSRAHVFDDKCVDAREPATPAAEDWMVGYYEAAVGALNAYRAGADPASPEARLARWLLLERDGSTYADDQSCAAAGRRMAGRLERYERRLETARRQATAEIPAGAVATLVAADLSSEPAIAGFVLSALVEGHLLMHGVEWALAGDLDVHLCRDRTKIGDNLARAQALLTFAFSISRTCPWIFAEDREEAAWIHTHAPTCWDQMVPTTCLWLATQLPLLALHRRAYARALDGESELAYKDYYKLQQQLRHADRRLRTAPSAVVGAAGFLAALDAIADHHIGELYRTKQAHTAALTHLTRADARLERLRARGADHWALPAEALTSSRWRIELLLSNGKAHYEMGRHKNSLSWYLRAWKALLELQTGDNGTEVNADPIDTAVAWLAAVQHEPVIYKDDVERYVRPITAQLDGILINDRLCALAADVLTRLGHLLFVLRTEQEGDWSVGANGVGNVPVLKFLQKAAHCDSASTMLRSDTLKLVYRLLEDGDLPPDDLQRILDELEPVGVGRQWQGGEDDFARVSRATEYVLLQELLTSAKLALAPVSGKKRNARLTAEQQRTEKIARRLLAGVFMHTDSINVRRAQVHERLAAPRKRFAGASLSDGPIVELVSMRRFSSAFALLPRPAAFRSLSGGYFVRIRVTPDSEPFGIVIDPGTDFVETLFRTGFSVADVQMIIVTHDHVDHMAALEPLLSLLYERSNIDGKASTSLPLLGNRGVLERHRGTRQYEQLVLYEFGEDDPPWGKDDWTHSGKATPRPLSALNEWLTTTLGVDVELVAVSSEVMGRGGHLDTSKRPSYGFALHVDGAGGPSVAFTSDMPRPAGDCSEVLSPLTECDVLIAHLSSLPLSELRKTAGLSERTRATARELNDRNRLLDLLAKARKNPAAHEPNLASRLDYAYWLDKGDVDLVGPSRLASERSTPAHLYLQGLLAVARASRKARPGGLFLVGELSEELGSLRGKVAHWVTEIVEDGEPWKALTADVGLDVLIGRAAAEGKPSVWIRCDTCDLDNDLADGERYHAPAAMFEVCIKGENEGIFYNCSEHEPRRQRPPTFLERLERYDMFGR